MAEHDCEHLEDISIRENKRKLMQVDDTSKKMKFPSMAADNNKADADVERECATPSYVQSFDCGAAATDGHVVSNSETGDGVAQEQVSTLSKRQMKKQKKKEQYRASLVLRRAKEKEKQKQKKREAKLNNITLGPSRKELKRCTMASSKCKVRVAIDMSFDSLMNEKDLGKCIKQILRCYSANRRAKNPFRLYITSFDGMTKDAMAKHTGYNNWDVYFRAESYLDLFDNKDIVYLTSESDNILHEVDDNKVYIIGGLVDHNSQKGLTLDIAEEKGVHHAQLPIESFLEMKTRKVLSIVHVFEILLLVSEGMSWKDALLRVMPARKGAAERNISNIPKDETVDCSSQNMDNANINKDSPIPSPQLSSVLPAVYSSADVVTQLDM